MKQYRDYHNTIDYVLEQGKEQGRAEGKMEGRLEGKLEMIKKMHAANEPIEKIIAYSGLSAKEIKKILKED